MQFFSCKDFKKCLLLIFCTLQKKRKRKRKEKKRKKKKKETRLKRLSVFKAAYRLTVFAQCNRNLKLLKHFCKTLEGSARYCKILHVVPDLLTVISYLLERHQKSIDTELKKKGMAALLSCAMPL